MSKKYLVRRENCRFIGPMSIQEFREGIRTMMFGLQDEVAAHCSPWVVLDNEALIKRRYPELAVIVAEELPVAWREMTGHAQQLSAKEKKQRAEVERKSKPNALPRSDERSKKRRRAKRNNWLLLLSGAVAIGAVATAAWIKTREEPLPPVAEIATLAQQADPSDFLNEMGLRLIPVVSRVNKGKDKDGVWLPYMRMYAFYTNGSIENLPMKYLRGTIPAGAPPDCSVEAWKRRWLEGAPQVVSFTEGKAVNKGYWTRALAWDPYWIRRRPMKGWYKPRSWFEGCLMSASVAMRAISSSPSLNGTSEESIETAAAVMRRLQAQLEIIQTGKTSVQPDTSKFLGQYTCLEIADSLTAMDACRVEGNDPTFQQLFDEHAYWQLVRLAMKQNSGTLDLDLQEAISGPLSKARTEDSLSRMDYTPELQYLKDIQQAGFKVDGAQERLSTKFSELLLKP